jgi:hypothetical protein
MKRFFLICGALLPFASTFVQAAPVLVVGTPADCILAASCSASVPTPYFNNGMITFASGWPTTTFTSFTSGATTISSPDTLTVEPYSTQSNPNYLVDNGTGGDGDGTANITISLADGVTGIGVGIADSDMEYVDGVYTDTPVPIYLQALGAGGVALGSVFEVTIPENTPNSGNGYFAVEDTTADIYGLQIVENYQTTVDTSGLGLDYSGLAIADVQSTPEPSTFVLLFGGVAAMGARRLMRKKA